MSVETKPAHYNEGAFQLSQEVLPEIQGIVAQALKVKGVDRAKDEKAYFKATRDIYRALVAAAAQQMLDDGASPQFILQRTGSSVQTGWELYLERHPEVKAKLEAEAIAKAKQAAFTVVSGGLSEEENGEDEENGEEGEENDF